MKRVLTVAAFVVLSGGLLRAQSRQEFQIPRTTEPPKIDAVLDDGVWKQEPLPLGEWVSYSPSRGDKSPNDLHTDVRMAYDDRNIYFAFHCFDPEPDKIRTTISRRDTAFSDDWIALSLDSAGTGQTAYHLFVNPSGAQMDALNTTASGEQFDADVVWDSAGRLTADGYIVEIRLPLQSIRFSSGSQVRMGLHFFRKISRTGVSYSWPEMKPGQWVFDSPGHLEFDNLKQPLLLQLLPSITDGISQIRGTDDRWNPTINKASVGVSTKYGITSNTTWDATINPDFSQVESDAFQVQVNQRFPTFFSEKRPFFMEGMGLFNLAGAGVGNLQTAVHTRRIIDPAWGSKLTGTAGKVTFGLLNASDDTPEDLGDRGASIDGRTKLFTIARATYALGQSDYAGVILTDTEHAGRHNRVGGGDLSLRISAAQQISATFISSATRIDVLGPTETGTGAQATYAFNSRRFSLAGQIEHYGRDFQMDTAFYNRTGFTSAWSNGGMNFYPKAEPRTWLHEVSLQFDARRGYDDVQGGGEGYFNPSVQFHFTRQGYLNIGTGWGHETWLGQRFKSGGGVNTYANVQLFRWLNVAAGFNSGRQVYYDPAQPFQGRSMGGNAGLSLQPNQHVTQEINYDWVRFDRASTGERVFSVDIVNTRTTYQFNKHVLVRLLEQFDSSSHRLLTDLLASYELVPGSVLQAGYGSLYEKSGANPGALVPNNLGNDYETVSRGLFFKASYLYRF